MTAFAREEFLALRATIRERGTLRVLLFWSDISVWAALVLLAPTVTPFVVSALIPLTVLLAGFEAVAAYHFGVERIGRYLQVFYEQRLRNPGEPDAQWEGIAMDLGHLRPTPTGDPLFSAVFSCATLLNVLPVLLAGSTRWQVAGIGVVHGLFLARILLVRRRAAGQRQHERTLFEQLAARSREASPQTGERAMSQSHANLR